MLFWTKEEYLKFADVMMDKPVSYYAFEILYWCGLRMGELLDNTIIEVLKMGKSPRERAKLDKVVNLMKMMK